MKNRILLLGLTLCVALSGCASTLERSYSSSTVHVDRPTTAEDSSVLRVEDYRELVSAVLYLVSQGQEEGTIQLYNYTGEVETDLSAACLEVASQDPLGAYAVDYIKHEYTRVVSYYQAVISIRYRRSMEQIRSMVNVTGTRAIRTELQEALTQFAPEVVLRVAYFSEDEASIASLIRQAYYDAPLAALGMPQAQISIYPDSGNQRVVEILLTYPEDTEELLQKREELLSAADNLVFSLPLTGLRGQAVAQTLAQELRQSRIYDPQGGPTAYAALVEGAADAEGLALSYALLCQEAGLTGETVEGTREGEPWFWNQIQLTGNQRLYLDLTQSDELFSADELARQGYLWPDGPQPPESSPAAGTSPAAEDPGPSEEPAGEGAEDLLLPEP